MGTNRGQRLLAWLFPDGVQCLQCGAFSHGAPLCALCRQALDASRLSPAQGLLCLGGVNVCGVWRYAGSTAFLVRQLKFHQVRAAARPLAEGMAQAAHGLRLPPDTLITWVPMPPKRLIQRGIDHARELAALVSEQLKLPLRQLLCRTSDNGLPQRGMSREDRLRNVQGAFASCGPIPAPVLLIDDVYTTGATVHACAEALLHAGAPQVYALIAILVVEEQGGQP